jgi:outer membrane protein OmpA-like peptidoglycan-associated protein
MKVKLLLFVFPLCIATFAHAQQNESPGYKTPFKAGGVKDNWFVQLGVGTQTIWGEGNYKYDPLKMLSLDPSISVGKWLNPFLGLRARANFGPLHPVINEGQTMIHDKYFGLGLNLMWNVPAYFRPYNPDRFFGFIPYIGVGGAYRLKNDPYEKEATLTHNGGILMTFRLSKCIDLFVDFGGMLVEDEFNHFPTTGTQFDLIPYADGGVSIKLGKQGFEPSEGMDYALVNDLNNKINALRAENDRLSKRPASCPECPEIKIVKPQLTETFIGAPSIVVFHAESAIIEANQQVSIYNIAQLVKGTNKKVTITGYADKDTGTPEFNLKLSEKRAKVVAKELTAKYGVPSQNVIVEWKGAAEQPYTENKWNRIVLMSIQK